MYKYIIFDFDGTLVDTNYLIDKTIRATAKEVLNKEIDEETVANVWGKVLSEQMENLDPTKVEALSDFYRDYYNKHREEHTNIFEGIIQMLEGLHDFGSQMGIVTNKGTGGLNHGLEKFQIKDYFKIALSKTDVVMKKPHPEALHKIMAHFDAKPEEILFVGDSVHDIKFGNNVGVDTVLVKWTVMDIEKLKAEKPTYIVESPEEIVSIVKQSFL